MLTKRIRSQLKGLLTNEKKTNDALLSILFQPITAQLFPIAASFPTLSILTIPLDTCQMKSFENINILIKVTLFRLKNFFFSEKRFYLKETYVFEKFFLKNCFFLKIFLTSGT